MDGIYEDSFIRPESLKEWMKANNRTHDEAAETFGFQKITMQKYANHPTRDIGVFGDKVCESKEEWVLGLHVNNRMVNFPNPVKIITIREVKPRGKMQRD